MTSEEPHRTAREVRDGFVQADSPHAWLRVEVARFLYPDAAIDDAFTQASAHLEAAADALDVLADAQIEPGSLLAFEVWFQDGEEVRRALFRTLPTPASLLLLCCDLARVDEDVVIRHYFAHRDIVEMRTRWPFAMDVAVSLTSPAALDLAPPSSPTTRRSRRRPQR